MKNLMSSLLNFCLAVLLLALAGCSSHSGKTAGATGNPSAKNVDPFAEAIRKAAAANSAPMEGEGWKPLFDGKSLAGWQLTPFGGHGPVRCESGLILVDTGDALSGINWTNPVPKSNYEIALDAMRLEGSDFFCGLTFPVAESHCSLI